MKRSEDEDNYNESFRWNPVFMLSNWRKIWNYLVVLIIRATIILRINDDYTPVELRDSPQLLRQQASATWWDNHQSPFWGNGKKCILSALANFINCYFWSTISKPPNVIPLFIKFYIYNVHNWPAGLVFTFGCNHLGNSISNQRTMFAVCGLHLMCTVDNFNFNFQSSIDVNMFATFI